MTRQSTWTQPKNVYVGIQGTRLRETDKAFQFRIDSISGTPLAVSHIMWIPFSQIEKAMTNPETTGEDTCMCAEWILDKAGLL